MTENVEVWLVRRYGLVIKPRFHAGQSRFHAGQSRFHAGQSRFHADGTI